MGRKAKKNSVMEPKDAYGFLCDVEGLEELKVQEVVNRMAKAYAALAEPPDGEDHCRMCSIERRWFLYQYDNEANYGGDGYQDCDEIWDGFGPGVWALYQIELLCSSRDQQPQEETYAVELGHFAEMFGSKELKKVLASIEKDACIDALPRKGFNRVLDMAARFEYKVKQECTHEEGDQA